MKAVVAVSAGGNNSGLSEARLGDQFFWVLEASFTDDSPITVNTTDLESLLDRYGLRRFMPYPIKGHDAFRRVTRDLEQFRPVIHRGNQALRGTLMIREVFSDNNIVERALVREIIDPGARTVDYAVIAVLTYYRANNSFSVRYEPAAKEWDYPTIVNRAKEQFQSLMGQVPDQKLRTMLRNIIGELYPTMMKRGVYFVPNHGDFLQRLDVLEALIEDLRAIIQNGTIYSHRLALLERDKLKVENHMREQTLDMLTRLEQEIAAVDSNTLTAEKLASLSKRLGNALRKVEIYETILQCEMSALRKRAEALRNGLRKKLAVP